MLLVYTPKLTPRLEYVFNLIFKDILGIEYRFTDDGDDIRLYEGAKISYCHQPVADELFFNATKLLYETGINEIEIKIFEWEDNIGFFNTNDKSALPFDPFAASFYLVSRYEEYLPHIRDKYERFLAKESLAYKHNFLQKPVVNIWANKIKELISNKYPQFKFSDRTYRFLSTIDIDNAYAYKEKGLLRTIGGYLKSFKKADINTLQERTQVLTGKKKDPFDTFSKQLELHQKYKIIPTYFILIGDYDVNDKSVSSKSNKFRELIKHLADYAEVGIHPSFASSKKTEKLKIELNRLSEITKREITKSRQHFLQLHLPATYRTLIEHDIKEDYTMGYATDPGFRASICTAFHYYDLDFDAPTKLKISPFCLMDATLRYYTNIDPVNAMEYVQPLVEEVRKVGGTMITIWHNDSMGDSQEWPGWGTVYEQLLEIAI